MRILLVVGVLASLASCADDGVRHTPDATFPDDAPTDAPPDAPLTPAMLTGSPGATAFGDVVLGQATAKVPYTISNDGEQTSGTIGVLLDSSTAGFSISENMCSGVALAPHETCTFNVSFQPSVAGDAMTTVRAGASPGGEVARDVTGTGLQPGAIDITEASHDYLKLAVDASATTHTFTIRNSGQVPIGVPMPEITGTVDSYSIASTTCTTMLAPSATCAVVVHFDPPTVGMKPGALVVTSTPGGSDSATLAGTGFAHVAVTKTGNGGGTVTSSITGISCGSGCAADFTATPVALTAAPDTGSVFAGWMGACSGTMSCSLELTAGKAVTAAFNKQQFTVTTATAGTGQGTVTGAGTYDYNTVVTVTATHATGSTFAGWSGDCSGMGACVVTMTQARSVTATFTADPETLTVTNAGTGGTVTSSPVGISCGAGNTGTCTNAYDYNTSVTLTETHATGSTFTGWTGACTGTGACVVAMTQARSVTATFAPIPETLTVTNAGPGGTVTSSPAGISCGAGNTGTCTKAYDYNTPVTLTETHATGSTFAGWTGACTGTGACVVTMTQARSVTATFTAVPETLTVTTAAPNGVVTSTPVGISCRGATCTHDFNYGTPVTLSATPDTGYSVAAVAGDCTALPCTVTMDQARSVTVRFAPQQFTLTTATAGTGQGSVAGAGTYAYNTPVTVTETPATGSTFAGWTGDCIGMGPCVVTMTQARSVTATFTADPETLSVTNGGSGGTITTSPAGINCAGGNVGTCAKDYAYGTPVTLTATPDAGHALALWAGACSNVPATTPTCTVTMDQAQSVTVRWLTQQFNFKLSFLGDTAGTVTVNGTPYTTDQSLTVNYGTTLNMTATSANGVLYTWGGACASQGNTPSCSLTITGDTTVSATFLQNGYRYLLKAITQSPNGIAFQVTYPENNSAFFECTSSPTGTNCAGSLTTGTVVTLVAHLPTATAFQPVWNNLPTWTGCDAVSTDKLKCTFTVNGMRNLTATGDVRVGP